MYGHRSFASSCIASPQGVGDRPSVAMVPPDQPKIASSRATVAPAFAARVAAILRTPCAEPGTPAALQAARNRLRNDPFVSGCPISPTMIPTRRSGLVALSRHARPPRPEAQKALTATCDIGHKCSAQPRIECEQQSRPWSTAMLAEIYILRLEAAARAAKEAAATSSGSRFVPITLSAAKAG